MSEKRNESIAQEQRRTKPKLGDFIASSASMDDGAKQVAHEFLDYFDAKNITYRWTSANRWNLMARSTSLGYIDVGERNTVEHSWSILLNHRVILQHEDLIRKEDFSETIYNNLHFCEGCDGDRCYMSCTSKLGFRNPDFETIENIRKILDFVLVPRGKKEPLTGDTVIGSRKITAVELRKFFKNELGDDYEKYPLAWDVIKISAKYRGRSLKEITDECRKGE